MYENKHFVMEKIFEWIAAIFVSIIGYLSPIKDISHMLIFLFIIDVIYGWLADKKLNKGKFASNGQPLYKGFQPKKVWMKTVCLSFQPT